MKNTDCITAERNNIRKILEGYRISDYDRLEKISDQSGFPVDFLFDWLIPNGDQEDLSAIFYITHITRNIPNDTTNDNVVEDLKKRSIGVNKTISHLPVELYVKLASLTSIYSYHRGTKTVLFNKAYNLSIKPEDAFEDGSKDTFECNGTVANNYYALVQTILESARTFKCNDSVLDALAKLYHDITTLQDDACNQQNAIDFARSLKSFEPNPSELKNYHRNKLEMSKSPKEFINPMGK